MAAAHNFPKLNFHLTSQPVTLRPPIRANPSTRGFAGGRNVGERSEAEPSGANPRRAARRARVARADLLGEVGQIHYL